MLRCWWFIKSMLIKKCVCLWCVVCVFRDHFHRIGQSRKRCSRASLVRHRPRGMAAFGLYSIVPDLVAILVSEHRLWCMAILKETTWNKPKVRRIFFFFCNMIRRFAQKNMGFRFGFGSRPEWFYLFRIRFLVKNNYKQKNSLIYFKEK